MICCLDGARIGIQYETLFAGKHGYCWLYCMIKTMVDCICSFYVGRVFLVSRLSYVSSFVFVDCIVLVLSMKPS